MLPALAANAVHLPPNLLKVIQRSGVLGKRVVAVVLNARIDEIHHACGGAANPLLHGFGLVLKWAHIRGLHAVWRKLCVHKYQMKCEYVFFFGRVFSYRPLTVSTFCVIIL